MYERPKSHLRKGYVYLPLPKSYLFLSGSISLSLSLSLSLSHTHTYTHTQSWGEAGQTCGIWERCEVELRGSQHNEHSKVREGDWHGRGKDTGPDFVGQPANL
jgi:hypothetical protein